MGEFAISSSELRFQFISSNLADETAARKCKRQPLSGHRSSLSLLRFTLLLDDRRILCMYRGWDAASALTMRRDARQKMRDAPHRTLKCVVYGKAQRRLVIRLQNEHDLRPAQNQFPTPRYIPRSSLRLFVGLIQECGIVLLFKFDKSMRFFSPIYSVTNFCVCLLLQNFVFT
jgi:hypothetical protein